ncbi:MAG: glycosyltransferase, partial [Gemmatimonadota bacterium]|nr:glycosyltransferase [Gemmatimonadota bacterium]
ADADRIREYYHVTGPFTVERLQWHYHGLRLFEKWSHALRAARHPAVASADLAYTRNLPSAWALLRAGRRVVYEHFRPWGDQYPPLQPFLRAVLRHHNMAGAIFHSELARQSYLRLGVPEERLLVAHNGWEPSRMEPRLTQSEARERLGLPGDRFTVVYTGRMNARKGLDVLLAGARQAPEMNFVLVGSQGEGPVEAEARGLTNVRVVPWQRTADLGPWLYAADVLAIPPSLEPLTQHGNTVLPIKLFLYLAAGRALLAPEAPDTAELLTDGVNAALVPAGDAGKMVEKLRTLHHDSGRRDALAAGALATAASLTWDQRAERIDTFLASRLTAQPARPAHPDPWSVPAWLAETWRWLLGRKTA